VLTERNKIGKALFTWSPVKTYGLILLLFFLGEGVYNITFPLYLVHRGLTYGQIGKLLASFGLGIAVFKLIVGRHSDIVGRKIYIVASLFVSAILNVSLSYTTEISLLAILLVLKGSAKGAFFAVRAPLIREISTSEQRGKVFGTISAFSTVGFAIGGAISGHVFDIENPWIVFWLVGFINVVAGIVSMIGLPKFAKLSEPIESSAEGDGRPSKKGLWESLHNTFFHVPKIIGALCAINFIQNVVTPPLWSLVLPVYLTVSLGLSVAAMGYVYTADNILGVPVSILGGFIGDRFNSKKVFVISMIIASGLGFLMTIFKTPILFIAILLIFMILFSLNSPILERIESMSSRDDMAGFDLALISVFVTLGSMAGQYLVGMLMDSFGQTAAFTIVGIGYLLMAFIGQISMPADKNSGLNEGTISS